MKDSLEVNVNCKQVGNLVLEDNEYIYSYIGDDKNDYISLTMPVRVKSYINRQLHPIFEMHLPEGYLLSVIKKHFSKLTKTDDFKKYSEENFKEECEANEYTFLENGEMFY